MVPKSVCDAQFAIHDHKSLAIIFLVGAIACVVASLVALWHIGARVRQYKPAKDSDGNDFESIRGDSNTAFGWIAFAAALLSLWLGCITFGDPSCPYAFGTELKAALLLVWIIGPPLTFLFEFLVFSGKDPSIPERFKYEQEAKAKLWLAFSTAITILFFGKDIPH